MFARLLAAFALMLPLPSLAADTCAFGTPVPRDWTTVWTRAMVFRVPSTSAAAVRRIDSFDTTIDVIDVPGVSVEIESGIAALFTRDDELTPAGRALRTVVAPAPGRRGEIVGTWPFDDDGHFAARMVASFDDDAGRLTACRIVESARPLERITELRLLGVVAIGERRCAVLRGFAIERRACVGDYVTREYGQLDAVGTDSADVVEVLPNGKGGWRERRTTLRLGRD
ncbi:MAG TPA: pilus assembly protein PilP [Tahibacter sp.]|nr:pilus assembly protein PilP [Tahibacter sp.]